jgi:hypothetical protein
MDGRRLRLLATSAALAIVGLSLSMQTADAKTAILVSVVNYPDFLPNLPNSHQNNFGFYTSLMLANQLNSPLQIITGKATYRDNLADWMFLSPNAGAASFGDTAWDNSGALIAYWTGHGANPIGGLQSCNTAADCTSPDPGTAMPGVCITTWFSGGCLYAQTHALLVDGNPALQTYNFNADIGSGLAKWGKSPNSGPWAGAGTGGGLNAAVLDMSHGVKPKMWQQQLVPAMAGIHFIATLMPTWGDSGNVFDRGEAFGDAALVDPLSAPGREWALALSSVPQKEGTPCSNTGSITDFSHGGGHGMNGCGCNFVISADATDQAATAHLKSETWLTLANDSLDATSNQKIFYYANCNFDAKTYPFSK